MGKYFHPRAMHTCSQMRSLVMASSNVFGARPFTDWDRSAQGVELLGADVAAQEAQQLEQDVPGVKVRATPTVAVQMILVNSMDLVKQYGKSKTGFTQSDKKNSCHGNVPCSPWSTWNSSERPRRSRSGYTSPMPGAIRSWPCPCTTFWNN